MPRVTLEDQYLERVQLHREYARAIKNIVGPAYIVVWWIPAHIESLDAAIFVGCLTRVLKKRGECQSTSH